jgi:hypothetical protein
MICRCGNAVTRPLLVVCSFATNAGIVMPTAIDCPGSEKDITEVSGTSSPGSIPGRGNLSFTIKYL